MADPISAAIAAFASAAASATTAVVGAATTATLAVTGSAAAAIAVSNFVAGAMTLGAAGGGIAGALGAAAGGNLLISALTPKPPVSATAGQLQTKVGAVSPRAIVMGRTAVAGTLVTPTPLKSGKDDRFATTVYALSHVGPSGVVESILWGDDTVTFDGNGNAVGKYNDNMWLFQKNGSWSQTAISFVGHPVLGSSTPSAWDSTKRGQGCLMVALVVRYAAKVLASNMQTPKFVVDANAVVLTDPRTGSAATTQAQRRNPAVWAYSWRLGWSQNSQRLIGMNQPSGEIHTAGYSYAANVADANGWTIGGEATTADDVYAIEARMLQACAAVAVERNGLQSVVVSALRSTVGTITSDMLRGDPKWRYQSELSSKPNSIQPKYRSESNRWQIIEGSEITDSSYVTADRGIKKSIPIDYPFAAGGAAHVGHLAALDLANSREPFVFILPCKQNARYVGFVGEAVNVVIPEIGLSSTKMVITNRFTNPDGTVDFEALIETDSKYPFAAGKTSTAPSFTLQPGFDIFSVPQPGVSEWASVATQITSGATSLPIVRVTGSAADYSFASGVVFKLRLNSGGSPWLVSEDAPPAVTQHEFRGLTNATSYIVGVAYRGVTGVEGPVRELAAVTTGQLVAGAIVSDSADGNLWRYSLMERGTRGYEAIAISGATITVPPNILAFSGIRLVKTDFTSATNGAQVYLGTNANGLARVIPAQRYSIQCKIETSGAVQSSVIYVSWRNVDDTAEVGSSFSTTRTGISALGTQEQFFATAPAGAFFARVYLVATCTNGGAGFLALYEGQITAVSTSAMIHPVYTQGLFGDDGADITGSNTSAGFTGQGTEATANRYRQSSAPGSPVDGDTWEDTSTTPATIKKRIAGAWVTQLAEGSTRNIVTSGTFAARPTGTDGDFYFATDTQLLYQKVAGSWGISANNYTNTNQLTDGANLGQTAVWANVSGSGRPADNATVNRITSSASAPGSPIDGDIWVDTNSPVTIKTRVSGSWVSSGNIPTSLGQVNSGEGTKLTGIAVGATKNVLTTGTLAARPTGTDGDFHYATDTLELYQKVSGSWVLASTVGATVGTNFRFPDTSIAPIGRVDNALNPADGNLFRYSLMERSTRGYGSFGTGGATIVNPPYLLAFSGIRLVKTDFTSSTNGSTTYLGTNAQGLARVKPSQRYSVQARTETSGAIQSSQIAIDWRNGDNSASLGFSFSTSVSGTSPLGTLRQFFATAPANAAFANVFLISTNTNGGAGFLVLYEGQITAVTADATVHPAFTQGPFGDDGADVTGSNTAAAIVGQGTGATASNLTGLNPTEGGKLSGIEVGADVTAGKTAAAIAGQGNNATKNTNAGLLSARPTGVDGDTYHATDTKEIYFKTGGSWVKVADVANTFTVSLSTANIIASGTGTTLTTGNVTATPSGGSGSYGYAWTVITKDVQSLNPFMISQSATSACRVTLGAGQAVEGTIQLVVTDLSTGAIQIKTLTYNITNTA